MKVKLNKVKHASITSLMKALLKKSPVVDYKAVLKEVKSFFPESKFNERHFSWYKSAYKRGVLKGVR